MVCDMKNKECVTSKCVKEVNRNISVNVNKVHNVALEWGEITDSVTGTHQKVNTRLFYNSKVKPAMVEADLARKFEKSRSVNSRDKAIRSKTF